MYTYWIANDRCPPILMKTGERRIVVDGAPLLEIADPPDPATTASPAIVRVGPNPFRDATWLEFALPPGAPAPKVQVFDLSGRIVRTLAVGSAEGQSSRVAWDGRDGAGQRAASGSYFARVHVEGFAPQVRRIILMR
jgi:hypothetical protein